MLFPFGVGIRRAMRRHQHLPRAGRIPMWRLLGGELLWALRQLVSAPWVLAGLVVGFTATVAVLHSAAPGPVLEPPWRLLVGIGVGVLLAHAARGIQRSAGSGEPPGRRSEDEGRPVTAATEVAGGITLVVLIIWLVAWGSTHLF